MTKATTKTKATKEAIMTTQCGYGVDVIEFHKHCDEELQKLVEGKQERYHKGCETSYYKDTAAHIHWQRSLPLEMAVRELFEELKKGYELVKLAPKPLDFWAMLKKPADVIEAELQQIAELAKQEYTNTRYELNAAETERQINFTVLRKKRAEEAAAAEAAAAEAAAKQRDEQAEALADLLRAYAEPTEATTEMEQAA